MLGYSLFQISPSSSEPVSGKRGLFEASFTLFVVRENGGNFSPEGFLVMFFFSMTEFMNHHIIDEVLGKENQLPGETQEVFA